MSEHFRFSVKLPKTITHQQRPRDCDALLDTFLAQVAGLGERLGCLLVQLPPSLAFDADNAAPFLRALRERHSGPVALEPRHASWCAALADALLQAWQVARVLADPQVNEAGRGPGGFAGTVYVPLHGSPRMYYSPYERSLPDALVVRLEAAGESDASIRCIFDNTAERSAVADALYTTQRLAVR